jgi:hypothetical protein
MFKVNLIRLLLYDQRMEGLGFLVIGWCMVSYGDFMIVRFIM